MVGGTSYFLGFGKAALTARGQCIQNVQNILKIQLSIPYAEEKLENRDFQLCISLKKTGQDPLNTSSLFIKIWSRIIIWPICTKTIEREQLIPFSPAERQPGIPAEPRVTHRVISSAELCWHFPCQEQSSAKALPAQIRVEKPLRMLLFQRLVGETHGCWTSPGDQLRSRRQLQRESFGIGTSRFCPEPMTQIHIFSLLREFSPSQIRFSGTWWELLWIVLGKIGHEIMMK